MAEFERSMIRERHREGIELARKRSVSKGRKLTDAAIIEKAREKINLGVPLAKVARKAEISQSTLYRHLNKQRLALHQLKMKGSHCVFYCSKRNR